MEYIFMPSCNMCYNTTKIRRKKWTSFISCGKNPNALKIAINQQIIN